MAIINGLSAKPVNPNPKADEMFRRAFVRRAWRDAGYPLDSIPDADAVPLAGRAVSDYSPVPAAGNESAVRGVR